MMKLCDEINVGRPTILQQLEILKKLLARCSSLQALELEVASCVFVKTNEVEFCSRVPNVLAAVLHIRSGKGVSFRSRGSSSGLFSTAGSAHLANS